MSVDKPSDVLRRRIRELREEAGMSQTALAEAMTKSGIPLTFDKISKIENGIRAVDIDEACAFADVLKVPLTELVHS